MLSPGIYALNQSSIDPLAGACFPVFFIDGRPFFIDLGASSPCVSMIRCQSQSVVSEGKLKSAAVSMIDVPCEVRLVYIGLDNLYMTWSRSGRGFLQNPRA